MCGAGTGRAAKWIKTVASIGSLNPRNRYFFALDIILLLFIPTISLALRLDAAAWPSAFVAGLLYFTLLTLVVKLPLFFIFGFYRRYWRYASVDDLIAIALAIALATGIITIVFLGVQSVGWLPHASLPRSIPFIDGMVTLIAVGGLRFSVRAIERSTRRTRQELGSPPHRRTLVVGAGKAGEIMVREMLQHSGSSLLPVGFVDDDPIKQHVVIHGVPVLGQRQDIPQLVAEHRIDQVVIAMPTATGKIIREITQLCEAAYVPSLIMPGLYEILSGQVGVNHLRKVEIEDLLRREPIQIDLAEVARILSSARVMVTGAGGSIGSELCRQIARNGPAHLILVGHGENSLFAMENELRARWPSLVLSIHVGDIRHEARMRAIFERTRPQIVFHAAAHKHVPLMEANCEEAVTNNVGGTRTLVGLSETFGVERFVLISSDKAVNPTNVMGATKHVAEQVVRATAQRTGRPYVAVRFGNVLGSRGSVLPTFREQIARGGPITITHPDVKRYFMTIPEAVQLVLQACALSQRNHPGQTFVLDMGEPIRIVDLARDLIELSGLQVGQDIEMVFTGFRPGEKLTEELFTSAEEYQRSRHDKIFVARERERHELAQPASSDCFERNLEALLASAAANDSARVHHELRQLVPTYSPLPANSSFASTYPYAPAV